MGVHYYMHVRKNAKSACLHLFMYNIHIYVYTIDCRSVYQRRRQLRQDRASIQRVYHFGVALDLVVFSLQAFLTVNHLLEGM